MIYIFYLSLAVLMYTYFIYPLYMFTRAKIAPKRVHKDEGYTPSVSVVFSVHNEEASVGQKIANILENGYSQDRLEVLVGSDGSDDGTNGILSRAVNTAVKASIFEKRRGKISVVKELVSRATGEIIVFCDTRQMFEKGAIRNLVSNFADKSIGCVSGDLIFERAAGSTGASTGVGLYWTYEQFIRRAESAVHSMIGAAGAIYAIRKELYQAPPDNTILDDVYIPLAIARRGYRCILDSASRAYDKPSSRPRQEYARKVRTLTGNFQIFVMFKELLVPFKSAVAIPLVSHKLMRTASPFFLGMFFVSNLFIADLDFYGVFLLAQFMLYSSAVAGMLLYKSEKKTILTKICSTSYMFCVMNFAALAGLYRFVTGKQRVTWER